MPKMLQPKGSRSPISIRELVLLVALVFAGISWYKEYDETHKATAELESIKRRFNGMVEAEDNLRQNPEKGPVQLRILEVGRGVEPTLRWTMELSVLDAKEQGLPKEQGPPPANDAAAPAERKVSDGKEQSPPQAVPDESAPHKTK